MINPMKWITKNDEWMCVNKCERHLHLVLETEKTKTYRKQKLGFTIKHMKADPLVRSCTKPCTFLACDDSIRQLKDVSHLLFHLPIFHTYQLNRIFCLLHLYYLLNLLWQIFIPYLITLKVSLPAVHIISWFHKLLLLLLLELHFFMKMYV